MKTAIELNALEKSFFKNFIPVELDVPVHASLTCGDETLDMVVLPKIDQHGHFVMDYSNASPFVPEPEGGVFTFNGGSMFGIHPLLERAWLSDDPVDLQLRISPQVPFPFPFQDSTSVKAKVISARPGHTGRIALWENQISLDAGPIAEARFNLVGFSDFEVNQNCYDYVQLDSLLRPVKDQLPEGWTVSLRPPSKRIVLRTYDGLNISICKQDDQLRGMVNHTGVISRTDESDFRVEDLLSTLDALNTFMAFVVGDYLHPTVVIGFSKSHGPSWGKIGRLMGELSPRMNWFRNDYTALTGHFLEVLFPMFWERWAEKGREIDEAIDLYVRSKHAHQNGNPTGALAESYFALEMLASLTAGQTIVGSSHIKIDQMLESKQVPLRLVNANSLKTSYFSDACDKLGIGTYKGVYLLNEIRNYVPHPLEPKTNAEIKPEIHEFIHGNRQPLAYLHDLSQFYFEHLFLAYCGPEFHPRELEEERFRRLLAEINAVPG